MKTPTFQEIMEAQAKALKEGKPIDGLFKELNTDSGQPKKTLLCSSCNKDITELYHSEGKYSRQLTCVDCYHSKNKDKFKKIIPSRYHNVSLDDFKDLSIDSSKSYFIYGTVGTGKTHLAIATALESAHKNLTEPMFCNPEYLQRRIRASYSDNKEETEDAILKPLQSAQVLVLDDLGSLQNLTKDFSTGIIYLILDYRWNYQLQTIITSNKTIEEIEKLYGMPIASRIGGITELNFIELKGKDRRCEV